MDELNGVEPELGRPTPSSLDEVWVQLDQLRADVVSPRVVLEDTKEITTISRAQTEHANLS